MTGTKILLLEDDPNLGALLKEHLEMQGYDVTLCVNGRKGQDAYDNDGFDLCLVDIMMPQMDGFTFVKEIRMHDTQIPIIFLTAKSMKEDKIEGFKIGCDDYVTKPFSMEELLLRMKAVLKRSAANVAVRELSEFKLGTYTFDYSRQLLCNKKNRYNLTPKECELLKLLVLNKNKTLTREDALRKIWKNTSYFSGRSMDVYISKLRKYLKDDKSLEIMGIHGKGFRLIAD